MARLPNANTPRPHAQRSSTPVVVGAVTLPGLHPALLVTVHTHCNPMRKAWAHWLRTHGVTAYAVHQHGDPDCNGHYHAVTYHCTGTPQALYEVQYLPYTTRVVLPTSTTVPLVGQGSGAPKRVQYTSRVAVSALHAPAGPQPPLTGRSAPRII